MTEGLVGTVAIDKTSPVHTNYAFKFRIGARPRKLSRRQVFVPLSRRQLVHLRRFAAATGLLHRNSVVLTRDHEYRVIEWKRFYPFGASEKDLRGEKTAPTRLGIGAWVHRQVIEFIARRFPSDVISHPAPQTTRKKHLHAMGINPKQEYTAREYAQLVRAYFKKKR